MRGAAARSANSTARGIVAWATVLASCRPYEAHEVAEQVVTVRVAFERLRNGAGSLDDFDHVGMAINVAAARATEISQQLVAVLDTAMGAFRRVQARLAKGQPLAFDGPGMQATMEALDVYEAILGASSPQQMIDARNACVRMILQQRQARGIK